MVQGWSKARGMAQPFIEKMARLGQSAASIYDAMKDTGIGYRKTDLLADVRRYKGMAEQRNTSKYTRKDRMPTLSSMTADPRPLKNKYQTYIQAELVNSDTGEKSSRLFMIGYDKQILPATVEEKAWDLLLAMSQAYDNEVVSVQSLETRYRID